VRLEHRTAGGYTRRDTGRREDVRREKRGEARTGGLLAFRPLVGRVEEVVS